MKASVKSRGGRYEFYRCQTGGSGHPTIAATVVEPYLIQLALERMQLAEAEFVEATVDPDLQAKLATLLDDIAELDRQLEDGEIPVSVYAKAASVAERDREALQELIDEVGSTGSVVQLSQQAQKDRDAARHLLVTLIDPATAEHAAKADTSQIPNARRLLKDTLGRVVVRTGRGSAEERVTIEA